MQTSELEIISAGGALVVLARGDSAEKVLEYLRPLGEIAPAPVAPVHEPPPRKTVKMTTGLRSAGGA
jgi:hypothetical protein